MAALRSPWLAVVMGLVAATCALLALTAIPTGSLPTTYRAAWGPAASLGAIAGLALVAAGALAGILARWQIAGLLFAAAAFWFAQDLEALGENAAAVRALAAAAAPLLGVTLLQLALAAPGRRLGRRARRLVVAAWAAGVASAAAIVLFHDAFLDVYCWRECSPSPLHLAGGPGVGRAAIVAGLVVGAVAGGLAAVVACGRLARAGAAGRRLLAPALVSLALAGTAEVIRTIALLAEPLEDPRRSGFAALYEARAVALVAVGLCTAWALLYADRARRRVAGLAADLGAAPPPGKLREALAAALQEPTVDVLYWRHATGEYVDAAGTVREPAGGATAITRGGRPLALVMQDGAMLDRDELEAVLGPAARLAIENEALRVQVLAELDELRASRTRIVAAGDEARRQLERDLHDGAQQRLLAVALELRLARARADGEHRRRLAQAGAELEQAFNELRELAHGIFPAVLTEAGLEAALATLASTAPVTVELCDVVDDRLRAEVEAGAYVAVDEALRDAAARGAQCVEVNAAMENGRLVVSADDDGRPRSAALVHVADRVGALGGELEVGPTSLRAEIPCG